MRNAPRRCSPASWTRSPPTTSSSSASRGKLRVVGQPFTQEYYGVGIKKGDTALAKKINAAIAEMIKDGSWERAIADNTEGTSYTPNAEYNPPKPTEGEK